MSLVSITDYISNWKMALYQLHINYRPYQCHCEMCVYLVSITSRPHLHLCGLVLTIQIPLGSALVDTFWHRSAHWQVLQKSILYTHILANYNNSLTWNKSILGWFLLLTMIPDIYIHTRHIYIYIHVTHIYIYTYIIHMCVNPWGKDLMEKNVFLTTWLVWMMWPASEVCTLLPSRQTFSLVVPWAVALWDCSKWQLMAGNWSKIGIWGFLLWFSCYGSLINSSF